MDEQVQREVKEVKNRFAGLAPRQGIARLSDIEEIQMTRFSSGLDEFDRVLGGGFVQGSVTLLAGEPGYGKSTLLIQASEALSKQLPVLYVSGEESGAQVAMRARRLGISGKEIDFLGEVCLERVLEAVERTSPKFVVIDSIQSMYSEQLTSSPGTVTQVRDCAGQLVRLAKSAGTTIACVGHVTKDGGLAGPMVLEHQVDCVLVGSTGAQHRMIRATKNRFGSVNELAIFGMTSTGLKGITNPSAIFMTTHSHPVPGSCLCATIEGTRPMIVELQALVAEGGPSPRRLSVGLERERLAMLLAVLAKHASIPTSNYDVFVNAVGGITLEDPGTDLAVMVAITSSLRERPLPRGVIAMGEIGLVGEVRPCVKGQERLKEAARLGMGAAIVPKANVPKKAIDGLMVYGVERVDEAMEVVRSLY